MKSKSVWLAAGKPTCSKLAVLRKLSNSYAFLQGSSSREIVTGSYRLLQVVINCKSSLVPVTRGECLCLNLLVAELQQVHEQAQPELKNAKIKHHHQDSSTKHVLCTENLPR